MVPAGFTGLAYGRDAEKRRKQRISKLRQGVRLQDGKAAKWARFCMQLRDYRLHIWVC